MIIDIVLILFTPTFYVLMTSAMTSVIMKLSLLWLSHICATCIFILIFISLHFVLSVNSRAVVGRKYNHCICYEENTTTRNEIV
jgi:hypothetical protein